MSDEDIRLLTEQLQVEMGSLSSTHTSLETDMQRLAGMLAPFMTPAGRLQIPEGIDPKILLFKQGLDFRLAEYQEDCRRLTTVQERLQRKLEEAAGAYEKTFMGASGLADARILRRMEEQQRVIQIQQNELDQLRFERDVISDEARRLRHLFVKHPAPGQRGLERQEPFRSETPNLHLATQARFAPLVGPGKIRARAGPHQPTAAPPPFAAPPTADGTPGWGGWLWGGQQQQTNRVDFL
jgi:hypothetical protein